MTSNAALPNASPARDQYFDRTPGSATAHERAKLVMPGGNSRQAGYWEPYPLTVERAKGVHMWDVDGNEYFDMINNYTALVHGHAYEPIVEAAEKQMAMGTCWAAGNAIQTPLAEQIVERVLSVDQLRFTNSGTEANALAFTIARTVTGRNKLLMARYGYHGSLLEFELGSFGHEGHVTRLAAFNDAADFERVLTEEGDDIAAVFIEPVLGSGGVIPASKKFLESIKAASRKAGAIFIMDEVLTLRFDYGGCQSTFGVTPDLTTFGKLIGGGFPVGAVGGCADLMKIFDPTDMKVFHTGTFNANPVTMAAGLVSFSHLTAEKIEQMHQLTEILKEGLMGCAKSAGLPLSMNHYGSCLNMYFSDSPPESSVVREDADIIGRFHLAGMNRGVFVAPRGMLALSTAFTQTHINEVLERLGAAMKDVAAEL